MNNLPCPMGTTIYRIYTNSWIGEDTVIEYNIDKDRITYVDQAGRETNITQFGKTIFLSYAEAEIVLHQIKTKLEANSKRKQ